MVITINGKECKLVFGLGFLEYTTKEYSGEASVQGMRMNSNIGGLLLIIAGLESYETLALINTIYGSTRTAKNPPSKEEIFRYVDDLAEKTTEEENPLLELFSEVLVNLKKAPSIQWQINQY